MPLFPVAVTDAMMSVRKRMENKGKMITKSKDKGQGQGQIQYKEEGQSPQDLRNMERGKFSRCVLTTARAGLMRNAE